MYDPRRAAGYKDVRLNGNGQGNGHTPASLSELRTIEKASDREPARTH
jgi:hypothetical protein